MKKNLYKITILFIIFLAFLLRFYKLQQISPYWEEVALGYDAYSILETAKDHHGNFMPLAAFESFGDFKPSLYFYTVVPFIKIFSLNLLAIRLPSLISGLLIVFCIAMTVSELTNNRKTTILSLLIASISPWAIHFSRAAWEANLATALICVGVLFGLKFIKSQKNIFLGLSSFSLVLSMYAYHSARIISPLLGLSILIIFLISQKNIKNALQKKLKFFIFLLISLTFLSFPLLKSLNTDEVNHRFKETSIFSNQELIVKSNQAKELDNNSFSSRIFYHRYLLFSKKIISNYFSHFNFDFLFISGDENPRHNSQYFGLFYYLDFVLLILAIYFLCKKFNKQYLLILIWIFISIIPASLTKTTPHSLRILPAMPSFLILVSLGLGHLANILKSKKIFFYLFLCAYGLSFVTFYRHYLTVYPKAYAYEWQYGYQEMVDNVNKLKTQYPDLPIYISRELGRPAMYYWFYSKTDPKLVQEENNIARKDQGEFLEFQNIKFFGKSDEPNYQKGIYAITKLDPDIKPDFYTKISDPLGKTVWHILLIK